MESNLYSENDVAEIVRRAAEMQTEAGSTPYTPGVTGSELARVAAEVGIAPEYVEKALQEFRTGKASGKELPKRFERVLPVELKPEDYDAVLEVARPIPGSPMTQIGSSLQGHVRTGWDANLLRVSSRNGRTKIVLENEGGTAMALAILWTVPLCLTPVLGALVAPVLGVAGAAACLAGAWGTYIARDRSSRRATQTVSSELEQRIL